MSRRTAAAVVFLVFTLAATTVGAVSTYNYYQFYPALSKLELKLTDLQLTLRNPEAEEFDANATFSLQNPTSYRGMSMTAFQPTYWSQGTDGNTTAPTGLPTPPTKGPLDPGRTIVVAFNFTAYKEPNDSGARIVFRVNVILSTFLDQSALVVATYLCNSISGPGQCDQTTVTVHAFGPGGIGGGT